MATNDPTPTDDAAALTTSIPDHAERLARWEDRTRPLIIAAAVLPLLGAFTPSRPDFITWVIAFGTWIVFVVDLVVHVLLSRNYLRTRAGMFDLFLVVSTFPYYLVLGNDTAGLTQALRLARLERVAKVVTSAPRVRRFLERLGRPVLYAVIMWFTCSIIVLRAEGPANGFTSLGVALWWGIVTLTTVGYGDLVPITPVGRFTASILMISGVALLGTVAASIASMFGTQDAEEQAEDQAEDHIDDDLAGLRRQVADLHAELHAIHTLLTASATATTSASDPPTP